MTLRPALLLPFALAFLCSFLPTQAVAQSIYAVSGSTVVRIDPVTGAQTTVTTAGPAFIGISSFDVAGGRFFFTGPSGIDAVLWSVNVANGVATQVPLALSPSFIEYDPIFGRLYGL